MVVAIKEHIIPDHYTTYDFEVQDCHTFTAAGMVVHNVKVALKYAKGGMVEDDSIAFVHARESVLTPEQTSILRNAILGNKPTSLMNLLLSFRDAFSGTATQSDYNSIDRGAAMTIENATVNMNVSSIANDYDARRAGEQALSEMVRIARKTSAKNSVGR